MSIMKVTDIKNKVAAKIAKGKDKVEKKCGGANAKRAVSGILVCVCFLSVLCGCQHPAQRAQTTEVNIVVKDGSTVTFGSEFVSLAQSNETGGNDAGLVATQTTETKPEVAVGVGGSSAGVGATGASRMGVGAAIGAAVDAVSGMFSADGADTAATTAPATADCPDGNCTRTVGDCPDGSCHE